jgi:uncharacterized membrane protein
LIGAAMAVAGASASPGASTISAACEERLPGITRNPRPNRNCFRTNCLYLVVPLPLVPPLDMPLPDVEGLDGEVDGLVDGEVDGLLPVRPPLPVAPEPAPLRSSCRHFSRSVPVRLTHLAGTSVEAPVAELPLAPELPVVPLAPVLEPDVWASVAPDRARSAAAVAAVSAFRIIMCVSSRVWLGTARRRHAKTMPSRSLPKPKGTLLAALAGNVNPVRGIDMERIEKSVEVACPVRTVYNQWTQFEDFPRFMAGVKEVKQLDDTHVHWHAEIWGKDKEWDAEITEQVPDQVIAWRSTSGAPNAGTVRFEPLSHDRTRVRLIMEYEPEGVVEKTGDAIGVFSARVENTVEDFKKFIESRGAETGAWRGEVHGGQQTAQGGTRGGGGRTIR